MKERDRSAASPVAMALLLLVLTGHAFLVSAMHFHRVATSGLSADASTGRLKGEPETQRGAQANSHAHCLLCRLQRNLVSALRGGAPQIVAPQPNPSRFVVALVPAHSQSACISPPGRAPPFA